jgi:hypothetical protein
MVIFTINNNNTAHKPNTIVRTDITLTNLGRKVDICSTLVQQICNAFIAIVCSYVKWCKSTLRSYIWVVVILKTDI